MLVKIYGEEPGAGPERKYSPGECIGARKQAITGNPDMRHVSTSYAERNNLNVRMHSRRMARLTNAFSKKVQNHAHGMALHFGQELQNDSGDDCPKNFLDATREESA